MSAEKKKILRLISSANSKESINPNNKNISTIINGLNFIQKDEFSNFQKLPSIGNKLNQSTKLIEYLIGDYKIDEDNFDILFGKYSNLPKEKSPTVKIFLSSTFSDFKTERNILYSFAFPKIRDYCSSLDLDFQFVDMR